MTTLADGTHVELHDPTRHELTGADVVTDGTCGRSWCDRCEPTPSARCPFEYDHDHDDDHDDEDDERHTLTVSFYGDDERVRDFVAAIRGAAASLVMDVEIKHG